MQAISAFLLYVSAQIETYGDAFGKLNGSSCSISNLSPKSDRGVYWCERSGRQKSINVTITVSDRPFIMEIPALPVTGGSSVTLRCRSKAGAPIPADFFKFGKHRTPITSAPTGEFTISNVQQSDDGFYWCSTGQSDSPSSRLIVQANSLNSSSASRLIRLICLVVVFSPYCISTGLMVSTFCCKNTGSDQTGKRPAVTMEMTVGVNTNRGPNNESDYDDVTTVHEL